MGRKSGRHESLPGLVRKVFGLDQATLGTYLHLSRVEMGHCESGRRDLPGPLLVRLLPLILAAPAAKTEPRPLTEPLPTLSPPDPEPLWARLDECRHRAGQLRASLAKLVARQQAATRLQQALPALLAAAPDDAARRWLERRQEQAATDLDAWEAARYHQLRARLLGLEAEAAALADALGGEGG
ncbi:hypothetical protein KBK19_10540 [Microvirga sp. STR05]|uniref:XRE family transcriptional regulator n=1 Tax=Hymenobacter duratus TaxID=2771356 RepID=A0ABR8JIN0_9BACT|nr:hypothetical protein [Hymenobacter duratus]MBD2715473.1 hypothetical protein [Hymenobacter duratus]MBR7950381.1 hypothetical protein [Microvirga sp. STR05]